MVSAVGKKGGAYYTSQKLDRIMDRLAEIGERLRVIESDIEQIQKHVGRLATKPPLLSLGKGPLELEPI
jgi:hypothetical protein